MSSKNFTPHNPYLAVDAIIRYEEGIVLVKRKNPPLGWALPGGFVEYGESVETAVEREVREETGLELEDIKQWKVFSRPERDPRKHVVTVCFTAEGKGKLKAATDVKEAQVWSPDRRIPELAFDHEQILEQYLQEYEGGDNDG